MRKVINEPMEIGETHISNIKFDFSSRDEIPKVLMGLQHIYTNRAIWEDVYPILESIIPEGVDPNNGRKGMSYWNMLVLASLRLNCGWDYDKLKEMADQHASIRQMLEISVLNRDKAYSLQTLKDNVALLTPEKLGLINQKVVQHGHLLVGLDEADEIHARCDSYVVKTNVHFPTDISLLFDAVSSVIRLLSRICAAEGITWWRQHQKNIKSIKKKYRKAQKLKHSTSKGPRKQVKTDKAIRSAYEAYLELTETFMLKATTTVDSLRQSGYEEETRLVEIEGFIAHAERQIEQTYRRVTLEEKIPHNEKVFSIFEEHTEWISKGKAGVPQELGLRVCVVEDQYGFIIHHRVMQHQTDEMMTVPIIIETKEMFPNLSGCSFDKGFHSKPNQERLKDLLDKVTLPKKGKLSQKDKEREFSEEFLKAKRKHSAVESAIGALQNHGLDICPDKGLKGFLRYVAIGILARNIQILGHILQQKEKKRRQRIKRYRKTWEDNRRQQAA
jgi:transposase, IS5 family